MIIIAGYSLTEAADRDAAVAAFQPMVERARREGGCIDLHVSADPLDAERMCRQVTPVPAFNEYIKYHGKFHLK
jgi:quinol monooxygenase YgiN